MHRLAFQQNLNEKNEIIMDSGVVLTPTILTINQLEFFPWHITSLDVNDNRVIPDNISPLVTNEFENILFKEQFYIMALQTLQ